VRPGGCEIKSDGGKKENRRRSIVEPKYIRGIIR